MDIKTLKSISEIDCDMRQCFIIGTHNGIFHSDEVVAIAILCLLHKDRKIRIIRTRDMEVLNQCDICVDVGGGDFDHHQSGFKLTRENGILYASAGLVWKSFGEDLICKYMTRFFPEDIAFSMKICERFDDEVISLVDCEDNGVEADKHCFSFVSSFHPLWNNKNPNFEEQFFKALEVVVDVFEQKLAEMIGSFMAEKILKTYLKSSEYFSDNVLEIPSQTIPWTETIIELNKSIPEVLQDANTVNFVIFPYPAGGWAAQCVPPSLEEKFKQRVPFPKEWAGQTEMLPEISTVDDAIFCHNGCFFARAKTKEGIMKMCKLAMEN